ncbi:arylesterase [soil metagenome]
MILVVGDSLSAEYGIARGSGWVPLLADRLKQRKFNASVVNASVSGDTSSGGLARLPALLTQHRPDLVIIELGGNDALRGLPNSALRRNLNAMIDASRAAGAKSMLIGMQVPPNFGRDFAEQFSASFGEVARAQKVPLVPFLLAGFENRLDAFQADRIHPLAASQPQMLDNVWPVLEPLLK